MQSKGLWAVSDRGQQSLGNEDAIKDLTAHSRKQEAIGALSNRLSVDMGNGEEKREGIKTTIWKFSQSGKLPILFSL